MGMDWPTRWLVSFLRKMDMNPAVVGIAVDDASGECSWLPSLFATKTSAGRVMQLGSPPQRMLAKATSLPFGDQFGWFSGSRELISRLGVPPGRWT